MDELSGLLEAVGPFSAYIPSVAWLAHILMNTITLAWPQRPAWVPPLLVILLSALILGLLSGATALPLSIQFGFQLALAAILAGVSAMLSRSMDGKATEAKRMADWEDAEYVKHDLLSQVEERENQQTTEAEQLTPAVSDDPSSRYLAPEEEEDEETERKIGFV